MFENENDAPLRGRRELSLRGSLMRGRARSTDRNYRRNNKADSPIRTTARAVGIDFEAEGELYRNLPNLR